MIWTAFILGVLGSWHCVIMCGPLALMIPGSKGRNRLIAMLLYFGGKTLSYALIGSLFGIFPMLINSMNLQSTVTTFVGLTFLLLAFFPFVFSIVEQRGFQFFTPLINLKNKLTKTLKKETPEYGFYLGILNGFVPCGLVYIAALGSLSQPDFLGSVSYMILFGIGTVPFLFAFILGIGYLKISFAKFAPQLRTVAFIIIGAFMIFQGSQNYNRNMNTKAGEAFSVCIVQH